MKSLVLMNVELNHEENIFRQIKEMPEVKRIVRLYGPHDFMIELEHPDINNMRHIIRYQLREIPHVRSIMTHVVVNHFKKADEG